jgi:hypothetical protein
LSLWFSTGAFCYDAGLAGSNKRLSKTGHFPVMNPADSVLAVNNDLPIRTDKPVHSGKVRSVYWLSAADSARLIKEHHYPVWPSW